MTWIALDVGGANLKAADGRGWAVSRPFALWRTPDRLADELTALLAAAPPFGRIAATMTGELADCFATKAEGVWAITSAIAAAAAGRPVMIYTTDGCFLASAAAIEAPMRVAASNWHALAAYASRWAKERAALLIDVGSTTADLIPIVDGGPCAAGHTDPERLLSGELVYAGVERTAIAALASHLPWQGAAYPVASELFATTADVYLLLGELPEEPHNVDTADGRPRTREAAHARLARMVCADCTMFSLADAESAAAAVREVQITRLVAAAKQVLTRMKAPPETIILSGHGEFLAQAAADRLPWPGPPPEMLSLNKALGPQVSRCAPAHALANLADEASASILSEGIVTAHGVRKRAR